MNLSIMQPYLFPYIGYFQLIAESNMFVFYDDAQYIKGGWINMNRIMAAGKPKFFTLPLKKDSTYKEIRHREFSDEFEKSKMTILRQIQGNYRKAPCFDECYDLISRCFELNDHNVSRFVSGTVKLVCEHLNIKTEFKVSSDIEKNIDTKGLWRVLEINRVLGSRQYINPMGGSDLYDRKSFAEQGLALAFLQQQEITYSHFNGNAPLWLSIVDVLMFNSKGQVKEMLKMYELV